MILWIIEDGVQCQKAIQKIAEAVPSATVHSGGYECRKYATMVKAKAILGVIADQDVVSLDSEIAESLTGAVLHNAGETLALEIVASGKACGLIWHSSRELPATLNSIGVVNVYHGGSYTLRMKEFLSLWARWHNENSNKPVSERAPPPAPSFSTTPLRCGQPLKQEVITFAKSQLPSLIAFKNVLYGLQSTCVSALQNDVPAATQYVRDTVAAVKAHLNNGRPEPEQWNALDGPDSSDVAIIRQFCDDTAQGVVPEHSQMRKVQEAFERMQDRGLL